MKSLEGPTSSFTLELITGITVTVRPRDWFSLSVASAAAQRLLDELESSASVCIDAGLLPPAVLVDLTNPDHRSALYHTLVVRELAVGAVESWSGIVDQDDCPIPVTPDAVRKTMSVWPPGFNQPLGDIFYRKYMEGHKEITEAKKDSAVCAGGISTPAPAANIATAAKKTTFPVRAGKPD